MSVLQVCCWVVWTLSAHHLPCPDTDRFLMNGKAVSTPLPCPALHTHWCSGLSDERGHVHCPGPPGREASLPRLPTATGQSACRQPALIHCRDNILYTINNILNRLGMSTKPALLQDTARPGVGDAAPGLFSLWRPAAAQTEFRRRAAGGERKRFLLLRKRADWDMWISCVCPILS